VANRLVLLLAAALLCAAGAWAIAAGIGASWADDAVARLGSAARTALAPLEGWRWQWPNGAVVTGPVAAGLVLALVVAIAAVAFVATRGGGRTSDVLRAGGPRGVTTVDRSVADAVISQPLAQRPEVLSAHTGAYRVRRTPTLAVTVTVRRGARLDAVVAAAQSAVHEWDALAGNSTPVLLHLADPRWRDAFRSRARVR
jgi:phage tail tape-measure protein